MNLNNPPPRPSSHTQNLPTAIRTYNAFLYPPSTPGVPFRYHLRLALRESLRKTIQYFMLFRYGDPAHGVPSNEWIASRPVQELPGDPRWRGYLEELRAEGLAIWQDLKWMDDYLSSRGPWAVSERRDAAARAQREAQTGGF